MAANRSRWLAIIGLILVGLTAGYLASNWFGESATDLSVATAEETTGKSPPANAGPVDRSVKTDELVAPVSAPMGLNSTPARQALTDYPKRLEAVSKAPEGSPESKLAVAEVAEAFNTWDKGFATLTANERIRTLSMVAPTLKWCEAAGPDDWFGVLKPIEGVLLAGLNDGSDAVRANSAAAAAQTWRFLPNRALIESEERMLDTWKSRLCQAVTEKLSDPSALTRAAAAASMSVVPTDALSAPALKLLHDSSGVVRTQVILSFAHRDVLLQTDDLLPMLHDSDSETKKMAKVVLQRRGFNERQIEMAAMIFDPDAASRTLAVERLTSPEFESDSVIDPETWILRLSRDRNPTVRLKAATALAKTNSAAARGRVEEIAAIDPAAETRAEARKLIQAMPKPKADPETEPELPPLPDAKNPK